MSCKLGEKLELAHKWAHEVIDDLEWDELAEANILGIKLTRFLNEQPLGNGVKLLALIQVLGIGADVMEAHEHEHDREEEEQEEHGTATVN